MSTSSLTHMTSTDSLRQSAPSSDTLEIPPPRPAPKRTYGRAQARPASPPPALSDDSSNAYQPTASPAKSLLDRWSSANKSWKDGLANLDAPSSDKAEEDEEELRREMAKLKREARGEAVKDTTPKASRQSQANPRHGTAPATTKTGLGVSFSSSSLTSIPPTESTSPPRSSPPRTSSPLQAHAGRAPLQAQSSEVAEETMFPIRRSGLSGKPKRIVLSEDEDEENEPPLFGGSSSRSRSPAQLSRTEGGSSPSLRRSASPAGSVHGDDRQDISALVAELDDQEVAAEAEKAKGRVPPSSPLHGLDDLFDNDEEEPEEKQKKKGRASKGLNKQDLAEMRKDLARAERERPINVARPETERLPISAWLQKANMAVKSRDSKAPEIVKTIDPGLNLVAGTPSSVAEATPDEITRFTPSSGLRDDHNGRPFGSSPTQMIRKGKSKTVAFGASENTEADEDEDQQDIKSWLDKKNKQEDRAKALMEMKLLLAKQQRAKLNLGPAKPDSGDELDFEDEVTPKKAATVTPIVKMANGRVVSTAKAVLSRDEHQPAITRNRQQILRQAGKSARTKNSKDVSETYVDHAAKGYSHHEERNRNAGAKPAGQKKGRDTALTQHDMDQVMRLKHQNQVALLRKQKEEDFGRVRRLPGRVETNVEVLVESSNIEAREDSDEDEEDGDFQPDEEEEEDKMVWSGEEAEEGSDEDDEAVDGTGREDEKENESAGPALAEAKDEDEEAVLVLKSKPRASRRVAFDSDDEDSLPAPAAKSFPAQRTPVREVPAPQPTARSNSNANDGFSGFDLAGFGSSGGSPGFSQLFDATQTSDGEEDGAVDAFAGLRAQGPVGLLPVNAMLPGVEISKTQAGRDNALIAAELENAAMEMMQETQQPKKQYLNEQGLFTQTKPAAIQPSATQLSDDEDSQFVDSRKQLGGRSTFSLPDGFEGISYGDTQTQTQSQTPLTGQQLSATVGSSTPARTQEEETFTRLRRRQSDAEEDTIPLSPTQPSRPLNAFTTMMQAASRPALPAGGSKQKMKSRLVDEQAEESDEDNGWAPAGGDEDEEEEGEDGYVEGLVDDEAIDEETKRKQDEAAAEKAREIQLADDARREIEARKVVEGQHRIRRRGQEFFSDAESDDEGHGRSKKMSKAERKKRKIERQSGVTTIGNEHNVFAEHYDEVMDSEVEDDVDETPMSPEIDISKRRKPIMASPPKMSFREQVEMLRKRAEMNRGKTHAEMQADDDLEHGPSFAVARKRRDTFIDVDGDDTDEDGEEESGFSISRSGTGKSLSNLIGAAGAGEGDDEDHSSIKPSRSNRSLASYTSYIQEESQTNRRVGGSSGVSVVRPSASSTSLNGTGSGSWSGRTAPSGQGRPPPVPHPHRQRTNNSSSSGSILMSKNNKFA